MERNICLLAAILVLSACGPTAIPDVDADTGADASVEADASVGLTDEEIMLNYEADTVAYQGEVGMLQEWSPWMIQRKEVESKAYISGHRDHEAHIYVLYENPIAYNPPWSSEAEHFDALKNMAELQYPDWTFTFSEFEEGMNTDGSGLPGEHDVVVVLGHHGVSNALGHRIELVWEGIFGHEFGHTLGLHHEYCGSGNEPGDQYCPEAYPPGEGLCMMDRSSSSFGPTEIFLLQLTGERSDSEINAAINNINHRYPQNWFLTNSSWDECGTNVSATI